MYEYPDYTYTQSAAAYNEWIADKYPEMNAEIARRIKEGRWEIVGGMWVEPDLNMPDGESLVRQFWSASAGSSSSTAWTRASAGIRIALVIRGSCRRSTRRAASIIL